MRDNRIEGLKGKTVDKYHWWRKHCEKLDHPKRIKEFTPQELYEQTASFFADQICQLFEQVDKDK